MSMCPKCNKKFDAGVRFCDVCGTELTATTFCANCGSEVSTEYAFCDKCGAPISDAPQQTEPTNKLKISKKMMGLLGIGVGAIALLVLIICLIAGGKNKGASYALYFKDNELYYSDLKNKSKPIQVTSELFADGFTDSYGDDLEEAIATGFGRIFSDVTGVSPDGSRVVFPDKLNISDDGLSLYSMNVDSKKNESDRIISDADPEMVQMSDDLNIITYITEEDNSLYQYNLKDDGKTKIASDVEDFAVSSDGKIVYYMNYDEAVYVKRAGKDREKVSGEDSEVVYISDDYSTAYILWEDALYKCKIGKEKEKIASDVYEVAQVYESGELYYMVENETIENDLWDYVIDDCLESDSKIFRPSEPEAPWWSDYDTDAEYDAAYAAYQEAYERYEEDLEAYWAKDARDNLRDAIDDEYISMSSYSLYYFDGDKETTITDACIGVEIAANDKPAVIYNVYSEGEGVDVKLSEYSNVYDLKEAVQQTGSSTCCLAAKGNMAHEFDATDRSFQFNDAGTMLAYVKSNEDTSSTDLYTMTIKGKKTSQPKCYDTDVRSSRVAVYGEDLIVYYKGDDAALFINGKEVGIDIDDDTIRYSPDLNGVLFFEEKDDHMALNLFQDDKVTKIADDVYDYTVTPDGRIIYMYDYSWKYYKGELYVWDDGKARKIDDDVICVVGGEMQSEW